MATREEFRQNLIAFGERAIKIRSHLKNEEATKVSLVLPFISMLGYDDKDPTEVSAEHGADFSEKYKNRVDYAILRDGHPIVAIECKSVGGGKKDDRGQLKSYFNASKTVKMGILTDGLMYEFFVDSLEPNMMDEDPFLTVNFEKISEGLITETVVDGLYSLSKHNFDPANIADNARLNLAYFAFFGYLNKQFLQPTEEFTRFLLKENEIKYIKKSTIDNYKDITKRAFQDVFNAHVLKRLDIPQSPKTSSDVRVDEIPNTVVLSDNNSELSPTPRELEFFDEFCMRMAYLSAGNQALFEETKELDCRKFQGKFVIFYDKVQKGRLIEVFEGKNGVTRYSVTDGLPDRDKNDIKELDERILNLFKKLALGDVKQ